MEHGAKVNGVNDRGDTAATKRNAPTDAPK